MVRRNYLLATTVIMTALCGQALANDTTTSVEAASAVVSTDERGTIIYEAAYFNPYNPNNAADMVNRIPGFSIADGDSSRGFEGAVGNVLVNGSRPASKTDNSSAILGRTPARNVERIELIRGGVPGIEMQGYSVVVNVILKTDASREHVVSLSGSFFEDGPNLFGGSYQFSESRGDKSWSITLSDAISQSDSTGTGPLIRRGPTGEILRNEMTDNTAWGGGHLLRGTYTAPLFGGKIDATARIGVMDWNTENLQSTSQLQRANNLTDDKTLGELGLTYTRNLGAKTVSETRFIYEMEESELRDATTVIDQGETTQDVRLTADTETSETILRSLMRYRMRENLELEAGGEVALNKLNSKAELVEGLVPVDLPSDTVNVEEVRGELFTKATWRLHPHWSLEGGLRVERSTISQSGDSDLEKTFTFAKPRAQLTWTPRPSTQLRLRAERVVGQLDFSDFAVSGELSDDIIYGGNAELEPEQRWVSELAFEQRFWGDGVLNLTYRYDQIEGVIDYMPLPGGHSARGNIGDGTHERIYASLTVPFDKMGLKGAKLKASNVWNNSEVTDPTSGQSRRISGLRPSQPEFHFSHNIDTWDLEWSLGYIPGMSQPSYTPDRTTVWKFKDYLQFIAEYKPLPDLSLRLQVTHSDSFNIYRTQYADHDTRDVAYYEDRLVSPRTFYQLRLRKSF